MSSTSPNPAGDSPMPGDDLRPTLDRIAAALEKSNDLAAKQSEGKKEGGEDQQKEGEKGDQEDGDKEKKDDGKGPKEGKAKHFFLSPLGIILTLLVLAVLIIAGLYLWHYEKTHESTDDAYTAGHTHMVSPRINGLVIELWVDDNQEVKQGDLLIKIDPRDYEVGLERAQASLEQSQAQVLQAQGLLSEAEAAIVQAQAQVNQAKAQVEQAEANYEVSGINYNRNKSLSTKDARAVSQSDVDTTKSSLDANRGAFDAAQANTEAAESNVKAAIAARESRTADVKAAKAAVDVAQANVDNAKLQLSYCWVLAPCDGRVSKRTVETGQQLSPGQALMAITPSIVWVLANYKETQLEHIRVGQRVKIPIDAFPGHPFVGRVDSIQDGTGAAYSLLPPDNATGNFTKIVQRVPVKITFDPASIKGFEDLIVPGLSCEPVVDLASASDRGDHVSKNNPAPPRDSRQE
jgi:membrane fusion protein (multidrug efflux system)